MLKGVKCPWSATSGDRIKMRQGRKLVSGLTPCVWFAHCLWKVVSDIRWEVFLKISCRTVFTKQLSLVNLAVMSIIMNYLLKSNGKDNCLKSRFCLSCKNDEMSLRPFWHNTVDMTSYWRSILISNYGSISCRFWDSQYRKNIATLKSQSRANQGHWKWFHLTDWVWLITWYSGK